MNRKGWLSNVSILTAGSMYLANKWMPGVVKWARHTEGPYRIFVYLKDEDINRVTTANIPFYVRG